jgi:hypothetical protein
MKGDSSKQELEVIVALRTAVDRAPLLSDEHLAAIRELKLAVIRQAQSSLDAGQPPVYVHKIGMTTVLSPSAQRCGMFQITRFNNTGVIGDSQYRTVAEAVEDNDLGYSDRICGEEAEAHMRSLLEAEARYQHSRRSFA